MADDQDQGQTQETQEQQQVAEQAGASQEDQGQTQAPEQQTEGQQEEQGQEQQQQQPTPKTDWRDREIARLRAQNRELRSKSAPQTQANSTTTAADPNAEFHRLVNERAEQLARERTAQAAFNQQCDQVAEAGKKAFPDFDQRVNALKGLVDWNDQAQVTAYNSFLIAAFETGDAPRLIHELGGDPNEAARIMALPSVKMAVELTKMAQPATGDDGLVMTGTRAPRPITPVTRANSNRSPIDPTDPARADQLSTAEWMRRMDERDAARRGARR